MTSKGNESLEVLLLATTILYNGWCFLPNLASLMMIPFVDMTVREYTDGDIFV